MAFLSGVLGAVKDDEAVKTYDNMMSNKLEKVLEEVNKKIGSGREGLAVSVAAVKEWLEGYGNKVDEKTNNVITNLKTLRTNINFNISELSKLDNFDIAWPVWRDTVIGKLNETLQNATLAIEKLDKPLQVKIRNEFDEITLRIHELDRGAKSDEKEIEMLGRNVETHLEELYRDVEHKAFELERKCILGIQKSFNEDIQAPINIVSATLEEVRKKLSRWGEKAQLIVTAARYKAEQILTKIDKNKHSSTEHQNVVSAANALHKKAGILLKAIEDTRKKAADEVTGALSEVVKTNNALRYELNGVKEKIMEKVRDYVNRQLKGVDQLDKLDKKVKEGLVSLQSHILGDLNTYFEGLGETIITAATYATDPWGSVPRKGLQALGDQLRDTGLGTLPDVLTKLATEKTNSATKLFSSTIENLLMHIKEASNGQFSGGGTLTNPTFKELTEAITSGLEGAIKTEVAKHIGDDELAISPKIGTTLMKEFDGGDKKVKTLLESGIEGMVTGILEEKIGKGEDTDDGKVTITKANFSSYYDCIKQDGFTAKTILSGSASEGTLPDKIGNIKRIVIAALSVNEGTKPIDSTALKSALAAFNSKFEIFTDTIKKCVVNEQSMHDIEKKGVKGLLTDLKTMLTEDSVQNLNYDIQYGLTKLQKDIDGILGTNGRVNSANLGKIIAAGTEFHAKKIDKHLADCFSDIAAFLETRCDSKINSIKHEALYRHRDATKQQLEILNRGVRDRVDDIKSIIDTDVKTGVKGLMRWMGGELDASGAKSSTNKLDDLKTTVMSSDNIYEKFKKLSESFRYYFGLIYRHIKYEVNDPAKQLTKIKDAFDKLLNHLSASNNSKKYNYDNKFVNLLTTLSSSLTALHPAHFANPRHPELLDAVKKGLQGFVEQMERVYVNGYDGSENVTFFGFNTKLMTDDGKNCAKIFFTILERLYRDMDKLRETCRTNSNKSQICLYDWDNNKKTRNDNPLGNWLQRRGYVLSADKDTQNGELDRRHNGEKIIQLITKNGTHLQNMNAIFEVANKSNGQLFDLRGHLHKYYEVCHRKYIEKPKVPSNIYQMLQWLSGLWYNPSRDPLRKYFRTLFPTPDEYKGTSHDKIPTDKLILSATSTIKAQDLATHMLAPLCFYSEKMLITILGHGHSGGRYAVDFNTNADNLLYPNKDSACFDMLVDILNRVYHQLHFLLAQCHSGPKSGGWRDCYYGNGVAGSDWQCNDKQCPNERGEQKHNQNCDQKCNQTANCGIKSPLQSFLEDGLVGFLPHRLTNVGCGVKCSVTNHRGLPCKTPMGFADIGIAASHIKTGEYMKKALYSFCGPDSYLRKICGAINCLLRQPPQTLGDMFSFFQGYLSNWNGGGKKHKQEAFESAVKEANFNNAGTKLNVTSIQLSSNHKSHTAGEYEHPTGDLFSLLECKAKSASKPNVPCGAYLQSISYDVRVVYSKEYAGHYLSWVVYISETFWDLLKQLYEQCCRNCNKVGSRCHDRSCVNDCQVNKYYASPKPEYIDNIRHEYACGSIINCRATHAAIYALGFTFGSPHELSGEKERKTKRTCQDLCTALKHICSDGSVLARLVHEYIPKFLWEIREKFFWTTVALWLLSLLYLIHIMVIRLDLLHIKSHLHSPSSHRIAAQSLLAAARVNKLNRVFYLQP
ncbi:hypothetical protein, conserved [Babesia bigemina]|nr:hypothetical protein, conserved [Babesia bigemina]CDR71938.1 hypothetical protein, conserved [Babesia bigemina]|eukprot:XP_012770880.1 hypothetical protein, conserved [Babesia bigemina]